MILPINYNRLWIPLLLLSFACKKNKTSMQDDEEGRKVYVVGQFENSAGITAATVWVNGVPQSLGSVESQAYDIFLDGDDVYITGSELTGNASDRVAKVWKNGIAQSLPASTGYAAGEQIAVSNGRVYVLGYENFSYKTALWIDGVKQSVVLPAHPSNSGNQNVGLCVVGDDVYTCGVQRNGAGEEKAVLMKNGSKIRLDTLPNTWSSAERVMVDGNDVYVTGIEVEAGKAQPRLWKNGSRQTLANLPEEGYMRGCFVEGSDVYAVGVDRSFGVDKIDIVLWKNGALVQRLAGADLWLEANDIVVLGGDVYIAGGEVDKPTGNWIAKVWKNGTAKRLSDGVKDADIAGIAVK